MTLKELEKNLTQEQKEKVLRCENAQQLLALAQAEGIALTQAQADEANALLHPGEGELSDDMLDAVAGGSVSDKDFDDVHVGASVQVNGRRCGKCGSDRFRITEYVKTGTYYTIRFLCSSCGADTFVPNPWFATEGEIKSQMTL